MDPAIVLRHLGWASCRRFQIRDNVMTMCACAGYTREDALGKPVFGLFEIPGTSHVSCQSLPYLASSNTCPCALHLLFGRRASTCLHCDA